MLTMEPHCSFLLLGPVLCTAPTFLLYTEGRFFVLFCFRAIPCNAQALCSVIPGSVLRAVQEDTKFLTQISHVQGKRSPLLMHYPFGPTLGGLQVVNLSLDSSPHLPAYSSLAD